MKYSGLIIFILVIVMNLLGGIMKKRAEKQKLAKLSNGKSRKTAQPTQAFRTPQTLPSQRVDSSAGRAEQLAARRKAQLDELRSRRERRVVAKQQPQTRVGSGASHAPTAFRSTPPQIPQQKSAKPQRVVIRPAPQPQHEPVSHSSLKDHSEHERADTQRLHGRREPLGASLERTTTKPTRNAPTSSILNSDELTPELLRRLVVFKEIFDKPVALRDNDISDIL